MLGGPLLQLKFEKRCLYVGCQLNGTKVAKPGSDLVHYQLGPLQHVLQIITGVHLGLRNYHVLGWIS